MDILELAGSFVFICLVIMLLLNMAGARQKEANTQPKKKTATKPSSKKQLQPTAKTRQQQKQLGQQKRQKQQQSKKRKQQQPQGARLDVHTPTNRGGVEDRKEMTLQEKIAAYKSQNPHATTQEAFQAVRNS